MNTILSLGNTPTSKPKHLLPTIDEAHRAMIFTKTWTCHHCKQSFSHPATREIGKRECWIHPGKVDFINGEFIATCCRMSSSKMGCTAADHAPTEFVTLAKLVDGKQSNRIVIPSYIHGQPGPIDQEIIQRMTELGFLDALRFLVLNEKNFQDQLSTEERDQLLRHKAKTFYNPSITAAQKAVRRLNFCAPYKVLSDIPPPVPPKPEIHRLTECEQAWITFTYFVLQPRDATTGPYQCNRINDPEVIKNAGGMKIQWSVVSLWGID